MKSSIEFRCGWSSPKRFPCRSAKQIVEFVNSLPNLEEGVVLYNSQGEPKLKVKSASYVRAHRLRGDTSLTEKRILDLIIMGETDEYLAIFPEDEQVFEKYLFAKEVLDLELLSLEDFTKDFKGTQKDFALWIKDTPTAPVAFRLKQGKSLQEAWDSLTTNAKYNILLAYLDK